MMCAMRRMMVCISSFGKENRRFWVSTPQNFRGGKYMICAY